VVGDGGLLAVCGGVFVGGWDGYGLVCDFVVGYWV